MGMLAWPEETGDAAYNLDRSEKLLCRAMDYLVESAPAAKQCLVPLLGDFFHYQSYAPLSESGHILDADSRFQRMIRIGIRTIRYLIKRALEKHEIVHVILELGNHDRSVMAIFMEMFYMHYENDERVQIDRSPRNVHVHEFGVNMIATHHGDKIKLQRLLSVLASDWPQVWGRTKYRRVLTGHVHHDKLVDLGDLKVETFGVLAPKDAYAANNGWRSEQSMQAIYFHRTLGEAGRNIARPEMFDEP